MTTQPSLFAMQETPSMTAEGLAAAVRELQDDILKSTLAPSIS